ncbi:MAG: 16S rRNA (adenine(1518)-N(6)/adenine(1519)-N(6))-dimethyltransferase RsmA [candidate division WOR-3 bacterium]
MPKRLGQHFLNNIYIAKKIINFADIKGKSVIEIGAGKGMITRQLSKYARIVYAIEIDKKYAEKLIQKNIPNVQVINVDFLDFDLAPYAGSVIVGNIPYGITTKIIEKLVKERKNFLRAILTLQKEYGERLLAQPGTSEYSSITCYVNYYFKVIRGFGIQARYFTPRPRVNSIVVGLLHKDAPFLIENEFEFFDFVKGIFRYRRKTLKNAIFNYLGCTPQNLKNDLLFKRPEELELKDFYKLYLQLKTKEV